MKRSLLLITAVSAVFLSAGFALGQSQTGTTPTAGKEPKLYRVKTLTSVEEVRNFEHDVGVMRAEVQAVNEAKAAFDNEKDSSKKKELKAKLDGLGAKLDADNAAMVKAYGFSIARSYSMEIVVANIYLQLTDEEAAKLQPQAKPTATK